MIRKRRFTNEPLVREDPEFHGVFVTNFVFLRVSPCNSVVVFFFPHCSSLVLPTYYVQFRGFFLGYGDRLSVGLDYQPTVAILDGKGWF
jgi:hypothetical protein